MNLHTIFNPKKSLNLIGYESHFEFFKSLISNEKFPKVIMLTGKKGEGKSTFVNHLMNYYFDSSNYDSTNYKINPKSIFYNNFLNDTYQNIIYLNGAAFKNIKVDDIRNLKNNLLKSSIINDKRFIILDEVETFNINSLNALLKIIEEPNSNNFFILINNNIKPILETIKSRCIEIKIILNRNLKKKIISSLINTFDQKILLNMNLIDISPGNFIKFNYIINDQKLNLKDNFLNNFQKILKIYKKDREYFYKDFLLFYADYYLKEIKSNNLISNKKFIEKRLFIVKSINDFFFYNLSQNTLISSIENNFINE